MIPVTSQVASIKAGAWVVPVGGIRVRRQDFAKELIIDAMMQDNTGQRPEQKHRRQQEARATIGQERQRTNEQERPCRRIKRVSQARHNSQAERT